MPTEHFYWYSIITGVRIGSNDKTKYGFTSTYGFDGKGGAQTYQAPAMFDSGTTFILIPME